MSHKPFTKGKRKNIDLKRMINRTLVRTKVVQTLFAFYTEGGKTALSAEKELMHSFSDTYSLYFLLLDLVQEITRTAQEKIEEAAERAQILHEDYNPNPRFVNNLFAAQLFENRKLRAYLTEQKLAWDVAHESLAQLYKQVISSPDYAEYMAAPISSYEADKNIWKKIFCHVFAGNEILESALEELEIALDAKNWATDMDVVMSYIVKTIKRFDVENGADQPLLEMFDTEEELAFAKKLLRTAIEHGDEYTELISSKLRNWDADRIAYMDKIILNAAIAELVNFPEIAIQVTLNEFIEIAREYSTEGSPLFINGLLEEILRELKERNQLLKAVVIN